MRKIVGGFKDKTNLNKPCMGEERNQPHQEHKTKLITL